MARPAVLERAVISLSSPSSRYSADTGREIPAGVENGIVSVIVRMSGDAVLHSRLQIVFD